ncbi:hypothetical protein NHX12_024869 [Muraenolepis orangiensis]|uniref:Neutral ceramidase n=1 Tax=Muraenolepis orangiensis TaxID=630683 RepID=A0A9Q0ELT3_9TELE|nr:hypothetical protein NHX12_024869 [Muraenolepis orangiensis]
MHHQSVDRAHRSIQPGRVFLSRGTLEDSSRNRSPQSYLNNPQEERDRYESNTDKQVVVLKLTDLDGDGVGMLSWFAVHAVSMMDTNRLVSSDNMGQLNSSCPEGGVGEDMFESTQIIGHNIYQKAKELYGRADEEVTGALQAAHQWVNMTNVTVQINATHTARTCKAALGHSFAAGTTDGGGALNFTQDALLGEPSNETQECHRPKPILFNTGEMSWPVPWHPEVVDVQILRIGQLAVVAVPGEMTTMAGRRVREAVKQELDSGRSLKDSVVIQRYEGASTIYGPHTLSAYLQKYTHLARAIAQGKESELERGPDPPFFTRLPNLLPAAPVDKKPANSSFGEVLLQVLPVYRVGDVVSVTFVAGNPRHSGDIRDQTFLTVEEFQNTTNTWEVIHTDASWETKFHWLKGSDQQSNATVEWHIPPWARPGSYRIRHSGHHKQMKGFRPLITAYQGASNMFSVAQTYYY